LLARFGHLSAARSGAVVTIGASDDELQFSVSLFPGTVWHPLQVQGVAIRELRHGWDTVKPFAFEWQVKPGRLLLLRPPVETYRWRYMRDFREILLTVTTVRGLPGCVAWTEVLSAYGKPTDQLSPGRAQRFASVAAAQATLSGQLRPPKRTTAEPGPTRLWWGP
jgi:hypothetical protein